MVQDYTPSPLVHPITPEEIEHRPFAPVKKGGVDEAAVRSFLREVAAYVEQLQAQSRAREEALENQVAQLRQQLEHPPVPSGQQLVELVGEEVARTLRTAQESSDEMRGKAEERALRAIRDAQDEAHRIRDEQLELANQNARAIVESARERGREMVGEARALRERVLADLNRRREALQEQLQEVRTGREELAATYRAIKQTFDESTLAFSRFEAGRPFDAVNIDVPPPPLLPPERPEPLADARAGALEIGELPHDEEQVESEVVEEVAVVSETDEPTADVAAAPEAATGAPTAEEATPPPDSDATGEVAVSPPPEPEPEPAPTPATKAAPEMPKPPAPSASPTAEPSSGPSTPDLDEIFKRIRAGRVGDPARRKPDQPGPTTPGTGDEPEASAGGGGSMATATATAPSGRATRTLMVAPEVRPQPEPPTEPDAEGSPDSQALATRDELLATVAVEVARSCKRALQDEQNELLDNLRRQRRGVSVEKVLPPLADQVATWSDVLSPSLDQVYVEARATAAGDRPAVAAAPRRLVAAMAEQLVGPLRDRVSAAVTDSDDSDADAIAQRIGARYREWKGQELDDRIGDVLAATYARGVYDAAPAGARLRWIPAEQGKCSDCDDNSLEPTLRGNRFPTGQPFPPAHPGCRCLLEVIE